MDDSPPPSKKKEKKKDFIEILFEFWERRKHLKHIEAVTRTNKKINAKTSTTSKVGVSFEQCSLKFIFDENSFFSFEICTVQSSKGLHCDFKIWRLLSELEKYLKFWLGFGPVWGRQVFKLLFF
jgi:hypothetical protein